MKATLILLFVMATGMVGYTQENESQQVLTAINAKRERMKLPPLIYRIGEQLTVEDRVQQISYKFALSDDCECDYESIGGSKTFQGLLNLLTNTRQYQWYHFEGDTKFAAIAVINREGMYYCVVRTYAQ